jgi:hypothetical protein
VSFGPATRNYDVAGYPNAMAVADFDGDGLVDIVAANDGRDGTTYGLALLRGLPGGRFAPAVSVAALSGATAVVAADFDGDGRMDLAVLGPYDLAVLMGNGDGTFSAPVHFPTGPLYPQSMAVGDLNGDGLPDLVVSNVNVGFTVLLNTGQGNFAAPASYSDPFTGPLLLGDFNGDHKLDVLMFGQLFLGNGDGTFSTTGLPAPNGGSPLAVDLNHDGKLDLVFFDFAGPLSVAYGNGNGTFASAVVIGPVASGSALQAADFNGDGWLDLVATSSTGTLEVFLSDGLGSFHPSQSYDIGPSPVVLLTADFDADGRPDAAVGYFYSTDTTILLTKADGSLQTPPSVPAVAAALAKGDFNEDTKLDLVTGGNGIAVWIGDGSGGFSAGYSNSSPTNVIAIEVTDLNHDGHKDIVAVTRGSSFFPTDGYFWVFLGDGTGGFTALPSVHLTFPPNDAWAGLLDGDVYGDLVISGSAFGIQVLIGNGDGTFTNGPVLGAGLTFGSLAVVDLRGIGKLDIASSRYVDGIISVFLGNGNGTFQSSANYVAGAGTLAAGDFNSDTKMDLLSLGGGGYSLLRGRGDGTFEPAFSFPGPPLGPSIAVADFNGDGRPDVAGTTGTYSQSCIVMTGNGDGTFTENAQYAVFGGPVIYGDWNGDGKPDLAIAGPNSVSILLNTNCVARRLELPVEPASCAGPGAALSTQPTAGIYDDGGNLSACGAGSVTASIVSGTGTPGAVLGGATTVPVAAGMAPFTNLSINLAGSDYVLEFTLPGIHRIRSTPISVHAPYAVGISGPASFCATASYSADPGFDSYLWTVDGSKIGGSRTILVSGLSVGPHTIAVTASIQGCSAAASSPISVGTVPPVASNSGPVYTGQPVQLSASTIAGATYSWTGPNGFTSSLQNPSIASADASAAGTYSVTATVSGCASAPASTLVVVLGYGRTFVSAKTGNDANGCTLASPCRGIAAALALTAPGGEVAVLHSGGYGSFVVTQAVSVVVPAGVYAGVSASYGDAITVVAGPSDRVGLSGLTINGLGGTNGINFISGGALEIEDSEISGFSIGLLSISGGETSATRFTVRNCSDTAVLVSPGSASRAVFQSCRLENNAAGLSVAGGPTVALSESSVIGSAGDGVACNWGSLDVEDCVFSGNGTGISATGSGTIRISDCAVVDNGIGLSQSGGGALLSRVDNTVEGNSTDVVGSIGTYPPK